MNPKSQINKSIVISASEVGNWLYCPRSWWFRRNGFDPENLDQLKAGEAYHRYSGMRMRLPLIFVYIALTLFILAALLLLGLILSGKGNAL